MRCIRYLVLPLLLPISHALADNPAQAATQRLDVRSSARIVTDTDGIPHIFAHSETDMAYLQGYVHARDRLFQMDVSRRRADGTLAELLGAGTNNATLSSDVMTRRLGLRRAAERSLALASREVRASLTAYAAGVNAYVNSNALPPEYAALELTRVRPWTDADSVAIIESIAFSLSGFDDVERTLRLAAYQAAGARDGFDGTALYFADTDRIEPFDPAATVPDAMQPRPRRSTRRFDRKQEAVNMPYLDSSTLQLAEQFLKRLRETP